MKTLNFIFVTLCVLTLSLTSCSNDEETSLFSTQLINVEEGLSSEGGTWSMATFFNPNLQLTGYFYLVVPGNDTYEYVFQTSDGNYMVLRFFPDAETRKPLIAAYVTDKKPTNAETDHSKVDYSINIDNTSASVVMSINGERIKGILSIVKQNTFGDN